jgi:tRNA1Val (adenine37-N6)-methyltransferase
MKMFALQHHLSSMKIGTDALLLGSWTDVSSAKHILEVGCGCGVISLMMAQRSPEAQIIAIDIDEESVKEANGNFKSSPFPNQPVAHFQDYAHMQSTVLYDLVVCNPPFFRDSMAAPEIRRHKARHQERFHVSSFFIKMYEITTINAEISIVFPYDDFKFWTEEALIAGWFVKRSLSVCHKEGYPFTRILVHFSKIEFDVASNDLRIHSEGRFSSEYSSLMRDFLLNF